MAGRLVCADCGESYDRSRDLEWHKDKSAACQLKVATWRLLLAKQNGQAPPKPPPLIDKPLVGNSDEFDLPDFKVLEDDYESDEDQDPEEPEPARQPPPEAAAKHRIFDSCQQVARLMKKQKMSGPEVNA
jgi:hypothetical protein